MTFRALYLNSNFIANAVELLDFVELSRVTASVTFLCDCFICHFWLPRLAESSLVVL